ncbi:MAG: 3,5-nucleoside bisphosphate phosphatase [Clostridia bacterium]|nr:3,5-nucleoside bisphosphate phosphatase [Clostridia bacterium]
MRPLIGDLHTHTSASDGLLSSSELLYFARDKGLEIVGITDHDSISGLEEALKLGPEMGLTIVPGVELSTENGKKEIHILGYYIEWHNEKFLLFLKLMRQDRERRNIRIIKRLQELGFEISIEDVEKEVHGEAIGRPHIAATLVRKGYVPSFEIAFSTLLKRGKPAYVPRNKISPYKAVEVILSVGGVPVLAHPGLSKVDELIPDLVTAGLQGIEVYYPFHDELTTKHYKEIANKYNLIITGGSDFHGQKDNSHADLGSIRIGEEEFIKLKRRAEKIKECIKV